MRTGNFLGIKCFCLEAVSQSLVTKHHIYKVSDMRTEFYQINGRRFKVHSEREIAQEILLEGKGVFYKGYVFFSKSRTRTTTYFKKYLKDVQEKEQEYRDYLGGVLFKSLKEPNVFPVVKSIIELYHSKLLSKDITIKRLEKYMDISRCEEILSA